MAQYTSVTVSPEGASELRMFAAQLGGKLGKRVTMIDALRMAVRMATSQLDTEAESAAIDLGIIDPPTKEGDNG